MGAGGAGFATFLSNCVACLYFFVLLLIKRGKTYVCINPKQFSFRRDIVSGVCAVGVPASIQNLLNVTGMTILNNFSSAYGADAVAAIGICQKSTWCRCTFHRHLAGRHASGQLQLFQRQRCRMKHAVSFARQAALTVIISVAVLFFLFPGFLNIRIKEFMEF